MGRFEHLEVSIKTKKKNKEYAQNYDEVYYINQAKTAQLNGDFEAALRYYSRALSYKIEIPEAWVGQVLCLIDLGEIKEAIIWTDKGIGVIGDNPELLAVKAMALGRNGELDRALGYSDRAIKQGGDSPIIWLARGDIFVTSDTHSAERCFRKAIECDKNNPFVLLRIGISYLTVQDFAPAISYLKRATILCPESSFILFLLGNSYRALGLIGNAKNYYKQALKINPGYLECRKALYEISHRNLSQRFWHWLQRMFGKKEEDFYGKD